MKKQAGFAVIYALLVIVVVGVLGAAMFANARLNSLVANNSRSADQANVFAELGLEKFKTVAHQGYEFLRKNIKGYPKSVQDAVTCNDNYLTLGFDLDRLKNAAGFYSIDIPAGTPYLENITLPDGTVGGYQIILAIDGRSLSSVGFIGSGFANGVNRGRSEVKVSLGVSGGSPYNNAIFASSSSGINAINGNVSVYGSVHLINGNLTVPTDALALSGNSGIFNSYLGAGNGSSDIKSTINSLGGDGNVADLCTEVKLASGDLNLTSGSATIGTPQNKIARLSMGTGIVEGTNNVYTRDAVSPSNYVKNPYGDNLKITMPTLVSNYPNDVGYLVNPANCPWLFQNSVFTLPPINASATSIVCGNANNKIQWLNTPSPARLFIQGVINSGTSNVIMNSTVSYQGIGTIRAGNSATTPSTANTGATITVQSLIPFGGTGFPLTNRLGLVTNGNLNIGTGSQVSAAVVGYAVGKTTVSKQTTILGSLVCDSFDIGNQVPSIAYEPKLKIADLVGLPQTAGGTPQVKVQSYERR